MIQEKQGFAVLSNGQVGFEYDVYSSLTGLGMRGAGVASDVVKRDTRRALARKLWGCRVEYRQKRRARAEANAVAEAHRQRRRAAYLKETEIFHADWRRRQEQRNNAWLIGSEAGGLSGNRRFKLKRARKMRRLLNGEAKAPKGATPQAKKTLYFLNAAKARRDVLLDAQQMAANKAFTAQFRAAEKAQQRKFKRLASNMTADEAKAFRAYLKKQFKL